MRCMRAQFLKIVSFVLVLCLVIAGEVLAQCAMCRTTIENSVSNGETSVGSALNTGILYLFATPYLVFLIIAFLWYKKSRQYAQKIRLLRYPKS